MADDAQREEDVSEKEMPDESDVDRGDEESGTYPCPYCGQEVYEEAIRCPHCQRYVSRPSAAGGAKRWIVVAALVAIAVVVAWLLVR